MFAYGRSSAVEDGILACEGGEQGSSTIITRLGGEELPTIRWCGVEVCAGEMGAGWRDETPTTTKTLSRRDPLEHH